MNKTYRSIYNESLGAWVAVSENDTARGKNNCKSVVQSAQSASSVMLGKRSLTGRALAMIMPTMFGAMALALSPSTALAACTFSTDGSSSVTVTPSGSDTAASCTAALAQRVMSDELHYYSVNGGGSQQANYQNDGATGNNALAIGVKTKAIGFKATAVGESASAEGRFSVAIGSEALVTHNKAVSIGVGAKTLNERAVALGAHSEVNGYEGISIGAGTKSFGINSIAIGGESTFHKRTTAALSENTIAIGTGAAANDKRSLALGFGALTGSVSQGLESEGAIAIGSGTESHGHQSVALGSAAYAKGEQALALGVEARAKQNGAVAIGKSAQATGLQSISIGDMSNAEGTGGVAVGNASLANYKGTVAVGLNAGSGNKVSGDNRTAIGANAGTNVIGNTNTAVGAKAGQTVNGVNNTSLGFEAGQTVGSSSAAANNNLALGTRAGTTVAGNRNSASGWNSGNEVSGNDNIASGSRAGNKVTGARNISTGYYAGSGVNGNYNVVSGFMAGANVKGNNNIAMGNMAGTLTTGIVGPDGGPIIISSKQLEVSDTVAVGNKALASGTSAIALGKETQASGISAIALGQGAQATAENTIAIGTGNVVSGKNSGAIGDPSTITGTGSYSIGNNNTITANNAFVLGSNVTNGVEGAVALGHDSAVTAAVATASADIAGKTYNFAGAAPISVVSVGAAATSTSTEKTRQIQNVAAGRISATSTDAINGSQLFATNSALSVINNDLQASKTHYYSVKSTEQGAGSNYNNDGALGKNSLAAGVKASTHKYGINDVAIGYGANTVTTTDTSVVALTPGGSAVAIGDLASAAGISSISIGNNAGQASTGLYNISLGAEAGRRGGGEENIAIGRAAGEDASTSHNVAIGMYALRNAKDLPGHFSVAPIYGKGGNIALGSNSLDQSAGSANVALGIRAGINARGVGNIIMGNIAGANAGKNTDNTDGTPLKNSIIMGSQAGNNSGGEENVAIGNFANNGVVANYVVALGSGSKASGDNSIGIGRSVISSGTSAIAIGKGAQATAENTIAIGTGNVVSGKNSGAIGDPSYITGTGTYSIGNNNGTAAAPLAADNAGVFGNNNLMSAGATNSRIVGNNNNVGQANTFVVGNGVTTTQANSVVLGNASTDRAATTESSGTIAGTTYNYAGAGSAANGVVSVGAVGKERQLINVAAGKISADSTDAINGSQLFATNSAITNLGDRAVKYDLNADGSVNYDKVSLTSTTAPEPATKDANGIITTVGGTQITNVASAGDITDVANAYNAVNAGDLNNAVVNITNSSAGGGFGLSDDAGTKLMQDLGKPIPVVGDGSITTTVVDNTLKVALSSDINVGGPGAAGAPGKDGTIGVHGADGKTGVAINGKDGSIGLTGPAGADGKNPSATISVKDGKPGLDGAPGTTTTRIVYTKPDGSSEEVATLNDGLKFVGNDGTVIAKKLNETLAIKGDLAMDKEASANNLRVDNVAGELKVKLATELTGLKSITVGDTFINTNGLTITGGPSITKVGIDAGGKQITNVASGGTVDSNAANIGDVKAAAAAATTTVSAGDNIVVSSKTNANGSTNYEVATAKEVVFDKVLVGGVVIDKASDTITGLSNKTLGKTDFATVGRAATEEQLNATQNNLVTILGGNAVNNAGNVTISNIGNTGKDTVHDAIDSINTNVTQLDDRAVKYDQNADGTVNRNSVTLGGTKATAMKDATTGLITMTGGTSLNNVASAGDIRDIANANKAVNAGDLNNQVVNLENQISNVGAAARTEVVAGENITVTSATGASGQSIYTVATAKNVKFDSVTADDGKGNTTTLNSSGTSVKNSAGNTANYGATGTQLSDTSGNKTTVSASGMAVTDGTHSAVYDAKGIHFTNSAGTTINNAPSITQAGVDGGGQRVTNVGNAVNPTDAVNLGQLNAAVNNNLGAVHNRIDSVAKDAFAGAASAMASAGLPQAYMPGKSMVAIAGSTFKSQSAVALGISSISDNGKWVIKGTVNSNSRGDVGATIGTGYQW